MSTQWNEKASQSVTKKIERIREELNGQAVNTDNIVEVLKKLHPEVSPETLYNSVQEIKAGIEQIYQAETDQMNGSTEQILNGQMEGMTEEQKKGFLCQLFDSIKQSDEAVDSEIENAEVDSTDFAQMSMEELQALVSEQLVNSIKGMACNVMEDNMEEIAGMDAVSLQTAEDALLLAAAQYSEALEGNISFEYTKVPRVLGQCAAAQTRIVTYCEGVAKSEIPEDQKWKKVVEFIMGIWALLVIVVLGVILGIAFAEVATVLMTVAFDAVAALLGTGIIALIAETVLIYPIMWVSIAAVVGAGALVYFAGKGVYEFFKAAVPEIKRYYNKLAAWLRGESYSDENSDDAENSDDSDVVYDSDDLDELAYT